MVSCGKWPPRKCSLYNPRKLSLGVTTEKLIDQLKMLIDHGLLISLKHTARNKTEVRLDCKCATWILWHELLTCSALSPSSVIPAEGKAGVWTRCPGSMRHTCSLAETERQGCLYNGCRLSINLLNSQGSCWLFLWQKNLRTEQASPKGGWVKTSWILSSHVYLVYTKY